MADLRSHLQGALGSAYTLERELGGMSRVFLAEETALHRKVVVKVLSTDLAAGVNLDRFRREIQVSAKLQHPHIVPVLSTGELDGVPYYTMPFIEGESLRARLVRGPLSITDAVGLLRDLAKALAYAHEHGVVHRDIKPDNILLAGGSAAVADFGIAKAISVARTGDVAGPTLTQIGTALGTPAYMAPEQAAADPAADFRVDVYAFGCVAYEVLTGRPPFVEATPQRLLTAQMGQAPEPVTAHRSDTPAELAALVMQCLEKEADARPQRAMTLVHQLETVTSSDSHAGLPETLLGGAGAFRRALGLYVLAFGAVLIVARAAVVGVGLPEWVTTGAAIVMLVGLPVILFTGYAQRVARQAATMTPTFTPGGTPSLPVGTMATVAMKAGKHLSWRRATVGVGVALLSFVTLVGLFMLLRALGIGPAGSLFAAGRLAENDRLLVAEFDVKGNVDSALGSVVSELIRTDLGQSRAVSIMPASAIRGALQRMQRPADARLALALARDVAQREGIKAVVHGEVTPLGGGFIITARLITPEQGDEMASFHQTAGEPEHFTQAVERLSRALRGRIGESLRAVHGTPRLAEVTTNSLEALRKYSEGSSVGEGDVTRGIGLLKDAIALDSGFAMAWRRLGVLYARGRYPSELQDTAITRAFRFRERLTQTERDAVDGYYYGNVMGDRERAIHVYEAAVARGDLGTTAHDLALLYTSRRQFALAESLYRRVIAAGSAGLTTYGSLGLTLTNMGRHRETDSLIHVMVERFGDQPYIDVGRVMIYYARRQSDSALLAARRLQEAADPLRRADGWRFAGYMELLRGRMRAAQHAFAQATIIDSMRGGLARPLVLGVREAVNDGWFRGNAERAGRRLDSVFARPLQFLPLEDRAYFHGAFVQALLGRPAAARALAARYRAEVRDPMLLRIEAPYWRRVEAEIALAEKRYDDAIALARTWNQLPDGPALSCVPCDHIVLARAHDFAGHADSAVYYYARFVQEPDYARLASEAEQFFRAAAHRRLGELYEARGDRNLAVDQYRAFVELWKNADPELQPAVADVRRRLARLTVAEGR